MNIFFIRNELLLLIYELTKKMDFKKVLTSSIIILLILVGLAIVIGSNKDRRVFFIDHFDQPIQNEIHSKKGSSYVYQIVKVKGEVNDTIIVVPCKGCPPKKLAGKLND